MFFFLLTLAPALHKYFSYNIFILFTNHPLHQILSGKKFCY
jgi:hypothetical protein